MKLGIIFSTLLLAFLFQGCASPRYRMVKEKKRTTPSQFNAVAGDENLKSTLHHVIYQDSPGSWKKKAWWDEYILGFENLSGEEIVIDSVAIHTNGYSEVAFAGERPWKLAKQSKSMARNFKEAGYDFAVVAGPNLALGAYTVAQVTSAIQSASSIGTAFTATTVSTLEAAATGGIFVVGYWSVVGTKNLVNGSRITKEFQERQLQLPLKIDGESMELGSAFFTTVPSPQTLKITYHLAGKENDVRNITINTPFLHGLHLKQTKEREREAVTRTE